MRAGFPRLVLTALFMVCLALPIGSVSAAGSGHGWQPEELNWYGISQRRLNDTRADSGLALLEASDYLWGLVHERARDMAVRNYLSHATPEGLDAGAYMRKDGARYDRWVEFRAEDTSGRPEADVTWEIVDRLLNDQASRAAIAGNFDEMGVAKAEANGRRVFVILLGKASPPPPPAPVAAPAPVRQPTSIVDIIMAAGARHGVDGNWLVRVARCESTLNPGAYNAAGPYIGLFQFLPATFYAYGGGNIYSVHDQADVAARMFARGLASHWPVCSRR